MVEDFILRALIASSIAGSAGGFLGCLVVWRRLAYIGDSLAHMTLLGAALGFFLSPFPLPLAIFLVTLLCALAIPFLQHIGGLTGDAVLGLLAHGALAAGIVAMSFVPFNPYINLETYLIGDILSTTWDEIILIACGSALACGLILWRWRRLVTATLHAPLARAEGLSPSGLRIILMIALALYMTMAIRILGVLLATSLLIIPPLIAHTWSSSPPMMALSSVTVGLAMALAGVGASFVYDTPTGATIVLVGTGAFVVALLARLMIGRSRP